MRVCSQQIRTSAEPVWKHLERVTYWLKWGDSPLLWLRSGQTLVIAALKISFNIGLNFKKNTIVVIPCLHVWTLYRSTVKGWLWTAHQNSYRHKWRRVYKSLSLAPSFWQLCTISIIHLSHEFILKSTVTVSQELIVQRQPVWHIHT